MNTPVFLIGLVELVLGGLIRSNHEVVVEWLQRSNGGRWPFGRGPFSTSREQDEQRVPLIGLVIGLVGVVTVVIAFVS